MLALQVAEHVHAQVERDDRKSHIPRREHDSKSDPARSSRSLPATRSIHGSRRATTSFTQLSVGDAAGDHLAEHGDVSVLEILGVDRRGPSSPAQKSSAPAQTPAGRPASGER